MKKIIINLLPSRGGETADKILGVVFKYIPFVFLALVVSVLLNIFLFPVGSFSQLRYKKMEAEWKKLEPEAKAVAALKEEVQALQSVKDEYRKLFSGDTKISRLFADLFAALPKNIWLEQITFQGKELSLSGCVVKWKEEYLLSLDKFIKNLNKSEYFSTVFKDKISLKNSRKSTFSNVEIVKFQIECKK